MIFDVKITKQIMHFDAWIYPDDGGWSIECCTLPGCLSCGDSVPEALENIKEAFIGSVKSYFESGYGIPFTDQSEKPRDDARKVHLWVDLCEE